MTKSEEFRAAHARAGNDATGPLYLEHPKFEGFEVRQTTFLGWRDDKKAQEVVLE